MHIWMVSLSTLRSFWGKKINALHPFHVIMLFLIFLKTFSLLLYQTITNT